MPDTVSSAPAPADGRMHWGRAIGAGVLATIVMTIVMLFFKMNLMKSLGSMMVGSSAAPALQYTVGGAMHFIIGIIYGIIFAALVGRVIEWNRFVKGVVYGLAIGAIALAAMPVMSAMTGGGAAAKNPGGGKSGSAYGKQTATNPCHPQAASGAMNPCHPKESTAMNPCHPKESTAMNPCHPRESTAMSPCHPSSQKAASNPCHPTSGGTNPCHAGGAGNPCNPCGGSGSPWSGAVSVLNHLVYALTLAFAYGKVR